MNQRDDSETLLVFLLPLLTRLNPPSSPSGTSASSFQSLVENFYLSVLSGTPTSFVQNVDDDYLSYIWSLLVSHPFVLVGKIKPNVASTQRKADELALGRKGELRMKKKEMDEQKLKLKIGEPTEILNQKDFRSLNWEQLKEELGESFRIVIEEEKVRQILTGTTDKVSCWRPFSLALQRLEKLIVSLLPLTMLHDSDFCLARPVPVLESHLSLQGRRSHSSFFRLVSFRCESCLSIQCFLLHQSTRFQEVGVSFSVHRVDHSIIFSPKRSLF